ncbi:MAG: aldo/keto reductase [Atopostipes sp.]|nr:aldo/keto reductase [Atopostipes sp.]
MGKSNEKVSAVALGAMRITNTKEPVKVIETAIENGINFFDHADIYGAGESEKIFSKALKESKYNREDIYLQSKLGIVPGKRYDFSKEHILQSIEGILKRLDVDYLDSLLLHRPDTLMDPREVAEAFNQLKKEGKVRYFGVSNFTPGQVELLSKGIDEELHINQLQFGLMHTAMIDQGLNANRMEDASLDHDGGVLEYSRIKNMTIQAWSPYQGPNGVFVGDKKLPKLNERLNELADKYQITPTGLAAAWVLRHPAEIQIIIGTMNSERIEQIAKASEIKISREDWYSLYKAAGNKLP